MTTGQADQVFGRLQAPLWIITSQSERDRGGLVATQLQQVSISPEHPRLMLGLAKQHHTCQLLRSSRSFGCHLFAEEQLDWVARFGLQSGRNVDKLKGLSITAGVSGAPILSGCLAWLDCRVIKEMDLGDRIVFAGQIVAARLEQPSVSPLTYQRLMAIAPDEMRRRLANEFSKDCQLDNSVLHDWQNGQVNGPL